MNTKQGIGLGLLISHFLIGNVLSAIKLGSITTLVTIGIAIYLFIAK